VRLRPGDWWQAFNTLPDADILTLMRLIVLTAGPAALVVGAYALSFSALKSNAAQRDVQARHRHENHDALNAGAQNELARACQAAADELAPTLPAGCRLIVRPPFVLSGDLTDDELDELYREAVVPVTAALWRSFYDRTPDKPVTIVALRSETSFHATAATLDGYEPLDYAGYTQRGQCRIVFNLATGRGTLAHELAHVLASFDFPDMPEWFDEGLAALHEDAAFSTDKLTLIGAANWRTRILQDALRRSELPTLEATIRSDAFRGEGEGLNYAVVRCFCHYLQERGLISHFYRKFRGAANDDPDGIATLCALLGTRSLDDIDRDFRAWVVSQ
jgi:hypothetical protein